MPIVLTNPSLGNSWAMDVRLISRFSVDGELRTVVDLVWPVIEQMHFIYENLSETEKNDLITTLENNAGLEVDLTDHEGSSWKGILNEDVIVAQNQRECGYSITFGFQGILQV